LPLANIFRALGAEFLTKSHVGGYKQQWQLREDAIALRGGVTFVAVWLAANVNK
jgi:hypothetical protein